MRLAIPILLFASVAFGQLVPNPTVRARDFRVEWDRVNDPIVSGYRLYCGPASRTYTQIVEAGNAMNAVARKTWSGPIYFAATSYTSEGIESEYSNEASWSPRNDTDTNRVVRLTLSGGPTPTGPWTNVWSYSATNLPGIGFWKLTMGTK